MTKKAKITVNPDYRVGSVEDLMFGFFLEPIRDWVYGGIWNPEHPSADEMGFRRDILDMIREADLPAVRLPGGNFVSGYEWKDGIGPKEKRRAHLDLAWHQYEPNVVGHDEYLEWARRAGAEPMYTFNMSTDSVLSATHCVEYTNHPGGTYWSDLRRENGYEAPHRVKTWYLGNEIDGPWQIGSYERDPRGYGVKVRETSKSMKWIDPKIETVAAGSCTPYLNTFPDWDVAVLSECYELVDYLSLHYYHGAPKGNMPALMATAAGTDRFLNAVIASCDYVQARLRDDRKMMISFDEYASNFSEPQKPLYGKAGHAPFGRNTFERWDGVDFSRMDLQGKTPGHHEDSQMLTALTHTDMLLCFLRHADRVKIACMTVGVRAAIAFDQKRAWKNALYYPYSQLNKYGRGTSLLPVVESPTFDVEGYYINAITQERGFEGVQTIGAAAVLNEETQELTLFVINRDWEADTELEIDVRGFEGYRLVEHSEMYTDDLSAGNTFDNPGVIAPKANAETRLEGGKVKLTAKSLSWNMIRLAK